MLFSLGHGQHVAETSSAAPEMRAADTAPLEAVKPGSKLAAASARRTPERDGEVESLAVTTKPDIGKFRYYFRDAEGLPDETDIEDVLDLLADSMVEPQDDERLASNSRIPPVFTYLGQFIDHDITANTDRENTVSKIDGSIAALPRETVENELLNLRDGSLALDSLYGDGGPQSDFADKLAHLMRFPADPRKMRLANAAPIGRRPPLPPSDNATDLLRLGFLLRRGELTVEVLKALEPKELRDMFINPETGEPITTRAIIGDSRNDENLLVAQLHVLFLRLHNKIVDALGAGGSFEEARRLTTWHYQWLIVNSYLPTICDPVIVQEVINKEAPLYQTFFAEHGGGGPRLPMPLEFSVAAFRFGHSMVRATYDHNRIFGFPAGEGENFGNTGFDLLFAFTGSGGMPAAGPDDPPNESGQLPQRWVIEWERFMKLDPAHPIRAARKIDTDLAFPLSEMANQPPGVFKHLARRNLRRGYHLNLPTAQACIAAIEASGMEPLRKLTPEQITSGSPTRTDAVNKGKFDCATPLWFYILKEAEVLACGHHLGPLGSHIVANTLFGLVVKDPASYWNAPEGRWSPDRFRPDAPIDSLEDVARFADML